MSMKNEYYNFESYDVNFKIISNRNEQIYCKGYVTINDAEAEPENTNWYFWDGTQYQDREIIFHDGIKITGATTEQENEIAQFKSDMENDLLLNEDVILQSDEDEHTTYYRKNITIIINPFDDE